jgi:hypothetical protein
MGGLPESLHPPNSRHIISCTDCGTNYAVYPPSSEYTSTMPDPCPRVDYQKSFFDCVLIVIKEIHFIGIKCIVTMDF